MKELELQNVYNKAQVDDSDFALVSKYRWLANRFGHVHTNTNGKTIALHRFLLNPPANLVVHHIDNNPLNNTRENLIVCTTRENNFAKSKKSNNTSGFKGVQSYRGNRWISKIVADGVIINLGVFTTPEEAAHAYDRAAEKYFGVFTVLNFSPTYKGPEVLKKKIIPTKFEDPEVKSGVVPLGNKAYASVDPEDWARSMKFSWWLSDGYALGYIKGTNVGLHRFILSAPKGSIIDHIDGNRLNCRKENLRFCTPQENAYNRKPNKNGHSKYKGVHLQNGNWSAAIQSGKKFVRLGTFHSEIEAAIAYDEKARILHKQFAKLNFSSSESLDQSTEVTQNSDITQSQDNMELHHG